MICYSDSNRLVFGTVIPKKGAHTFEKIVDISKAGNEFYSLLDITTYEELKDNKDPALFHERFHDCLVRGDCYTYKKSKIDFKKCLAYLELYDKKQKMGEVREFHLERPLLSEFCMKGSFNSFLIGRKISGSDNCNLYNMLGKK